jgi:cytochrome c oxidase subunit 2
MYNNEITPASNFVKGVDSVFLLILGISFLFLISLTTIMVVFIIRYNRKKNPVATQFEGSTRLEILWTVVPFVLTMVMFYFGWAGWKPMRNAPKNSMNVTVYGRMWNFLFEYDNGRKSDTLFLPVGQPVKLNLVALDVLHSFYIPAFRVKQDMVPNLKNNSMWFIPQKEGKYDIFCAEYCGLQHSYMNSFVKVLGSGAFNNWIAETAEVAGGAIESPEAAGKRIMQNIGCFACHTLDGRKLVGPSFKGIYNKKEIVETNGKEREILVDNAYIKNSIYNPGNDVVKGFGKGLMISYKGQLTDNDISQIIEFLKTVK